MTSSTHAGDLAPYLTDPMKFAEELYSNLGVDGDDTILNPAKPDHDAYRAALRVLEKLHPDEASAGGPINVLDERVFAWVNASHIAGMRLRILSEELRRGLLAIADRSSS